MRRANTAMSLSALLLAAVALGGCGGSTTAHSLKLPPITKTVPVKLSSSAIHGTRLAALYTCAGRNISPPLSWGTVPSDVEELALFAVDVTRGKSGRLSGKITWAMAGVNPRLHSLRAGEIPRGAFLEQDSDGKTGYSICPAAGQTGHYEFELLALPPRIRASPALKSVALFHNLTGKIPQGRSPAAGVVSATYTRP